MMVEEHGSTKTTTISRRKAGQLQQQTVFYHFSACHQRPRVLASSQMPQMHSTHWSAAERRNYIHTGKLSKLLDHSKHNKLNEIIKYNRRKKKRTSGEHPLFEVGSLLQPGNVAMHLSAPTTRSLRPAAAETPTLFFCSLRIFVAFKYSPNINLASTTPPCPEYPWVS